MKVVKIIGIVILLSSIQTVLTGQESDYLSKMENIFEVKHHHTDYSQYIRHASNPLEFVFASLFVGYKYLLSSQDMGSCVFYPSCSVYGIESIKKKGIILGTINTFDRLTRCHPFASSNYLFDPVKMKLYDPVD
jgi:putative membrane protein insertion efficiency factor